MAPTCDLCILVFCIVTAKCNVVRIELVCMDINTFLFMSICRCRAINYSVQCLHLHCVVLQPSVGTVHVYHSATLHCVASVQAHCSTRLHCVVTAGAQKWPSIHPSLINQNQSLITVMIMIGVHGEYGDKNLFISAKSPLFNFCI